MKVVHEKDHLDLDRLEPGRHVLSLQVVEHHHRSPNELSVLDVLVHVIVGRKIHPRLAVVGGIHGNEYDGIFAAQRLAHDVSADRLEGTLIVIPVANPSAFGAGQRFTPLDGVDLNRVFPGSVSGGVTERLAHALTEKILKHVDLAFTMHGGGADSNLAWYVEFLDEDSDVGRRSYAAAVATGFKDLVAIAPTTKGFLLPALGALGVPVIEGEVGGRSELHASNVDYYFSRALAVMHHLRIVAAADTPASEAPSVWKSNEALANSEGVLQRHVALNDAVEEGQHLASIVDVNGASVGEIYSEWSGRIGGFRGNSWIRAGQVAFWIFVSAKTRTADVAAFSRRSA